MAVIDNLNHKVPNGGTRYVALLTAMPDATGQAFTEVSGNGYARVAWSSWIDETIDAITYRKNRGTIEFPVLTGPVSGVVGYAIFFDLFYGQAIAWGTFVNTADEAIVKNFFASEIPRFIDQELKIGATAGNSVEIIAPARSVYYVAYSPTLKIFAACSSGSQIQSSLDGRTWTDRFASSSTYTEMIWSAEMNLFVAIALAGAIGERVATSPDGINWTHRSATSTNLWQGVVYVDWLNLFVAVASTGTNRVMTSANAIAWSAVSADGGTWRRIAASGSRLVAVSSDGIVMHSVNGTSWTTGTAAWAGQNWNDVVWSPTLGLFLAIAANNAYSMTSADGITWTQRTMPTTELWQRVKWSALLNVFIATSSSGAAASRCAISTNGIAWTTVNIVVSNSFLEINAEHPDFVLLTSYAADSLLYITPFILSAGYAEVDVVDENSLAKMQSYLPPGLAWTRDSDAVLTFFQRALAYTYARITRRALDLAEETDPRTTYEMLDDWERVYGLPDDCSQPTSLANRRLALQKKMQGNEAPTVANLKLIATALGYTVGIRVYRRADIFTCVSTCNASLYSDQWMFVWTVAYWPAANTAQLICELQHVTPAHTLLVDNPRTWRNGTLPVNSDTQWRSIAYAPALGGFAAVAILGTSLARVATSRDGENWVMQNAAAANQWTSVCWSASLAIFCAVASSGADRVMTSADGVTWTIRVAAFSIGWTDVIWVEALALFVAVGSALSTGLVMTSPTGVVWTQRTVPASGNIDGVAYAPSLGKLIAVGGVGAITSTNASTWTAVVDAVASANIWYSVAWSETLGIFVAVGDSVIMSSPTGVVWTSRISPIYTWRRVRWIPEINAFIAVGNSTPGLPGISAFSFDGITWTSLATGFVDTVIFYDVAYSTASQITVAVSSNKTVTRSIVMKERPPY